MKCLEIKDKKLCLAEREKPTPAQDEILIKVHYAGINRPDILQRLGHYPPPEGVSDIAGLEVAGIVEQGNDEFPTGMAVCALLAGGGYADYVVAPTGQILPSESLPLQQAAALPETVFTVWANLGEAFLSKRENPCLLVHGGASGIGTAAIQMAKFFGWHVITTASSSAKIAYCEKIGADQAINYKETAFETVIDRPVDYALDMVGGDYINRNMQIMAQGATHISIAMLGGRQAQIDIRLLMQKQLILTGSTLRNRPLVEKARLRDEIRHHVWPAILDGKIKAQIDKIFPLEQGQQAHEYMDSGNHCGKIVLTLCDQAS